jgi:hypothetical protein
LTRTSQRSITGSDGERTLGAFGAVALDAVAFDADDAFDALSAFDALGAFEDTGRGVAATVARGIRTEPSATSAETFMVGSDARACADQLCEGRGSEGASESGGVFGTASEGEEFGVESGDAFGVAFGGDRLDGGFVVELDGDAPDVESGAAILG